MKLVLILICFTSSIFAKNCEEVIKGLLNHKADEMNAFIDEISPSDSVKELATFGKPSVIFKDNSVLSYNYRNTTDKDELNYIRKFQNIDKELHSRCEITNNNYKNFPDFQSSQPDIQKKQFSGSMEVFETTVYDHLTHEIAVNSKQVFVEKSESGKIKSILVDFKYASDPNNHRSFEYRKKVKYEFNSSCELSNYIENDNSKRMLQNHSEIIVNSAVCTEVAMDDKALKDLVQRQCSPQVQPMLGIGVSLSSKNKLNNFEKIQCPSYASGYKCPVDGEMTTEMPIYGIDKDKLERVRKICSDNKFYSDSIQVKPKSLDLNYKNTISF